MISFASVFLKDYKETIEEGKLENGNFLILGVIGVVINFFDALGLGSFAPTTAVLKATKLCDEKLIPGTLNVATTIPVALEAIILLKIIRIDIPTTLEMVFFCTLGACIGAKYVSKLPEKKVQECTGAVLLIFAVVMMAALFKAIPLGGEAFALKDMQDQKAVVTLPADDVCRVAKIVACADRIEEHGPSHFARCVKIDI